MRASKDAISTVYRDFCNVIQEELAAKVTYRDIKRDPRSKHIKSIKKPYWSDTLDRLYKDFRAIDRRWCKSHGAQRRLLEVERSAKRKELDGKYKGQSIVYIGIRCSKRFWLLKLRIRKTFGNILVKWA
jgi:CRISPR/Cas system type I-B associated protein Csh2 (Cas7 group RAMP superfamily)